MEDSINSLRSRYVVKARKNSNVSIKPKMERNLQPEIVRIQAVNSSISEMEYISPSEAKRLLHDIEALQSKIAEWID